MITPEEKKLIHECIDAATGFGYCAYLTEDNKPQCVIAQIAFRLGVPAEEMSKWGGKSINYVGCVVNTNLPPLISDNLINMTELQIYWDRNHRDNLLADENATRAKMHQFVETW